MPAAWVLRREAKPTLQNAWNRLYPHARREVKREWRAYGHLDAVLFMVPKFDRIDIRIDHTYKGPSPDAVSCFPSVKAYIDGLVDAGVIEDDSPEYIGTYIFTTPRRTGVHALTFTITESEEPFVEEKPVNPRRKKAKVLVETRVEDPVKSGHEAVEDESLLKPKSKPKAKSGTKNKAGKRKAKG